MSEGKYKRPKWDTPEIEDWDDSLPDMEYDDDSDFYWNDGRPTGVASTVAQCYPRQCYPRLQCYPRPCYPRQCYPRLQCYPRPCYPRLQCYPRQCYPWQCYPWQCYPRRNY